MSHHHWHGGAAIAGPNAGPGSGSRKRPVTGDAIVKTYNHGVPWEEAYHTTQAYDINGTIYISGQFSHDMRGNFIGEGDFKTQTLQTFSNIDRVLAGFGLTKSNIAEMDVYLTNPKNQFDSFWSALQGLRR